MYDNKNNNNNHHNHQTNTNIFLLLFVSTRYFVLRIRVVKPMRCWHPPHSSRIMVVVVVIVSRSMDNRYHRKDNTSSPITILCVWMESPLPDGKP